MKKRPRAAADAAYIRRHIIFPAAVIFALLGAGVILLVIALGPDPLLDTSDADLIASAEESVEAQAFLRHYPGALATVDRSGRVAVGLPRGLGATSSLPRARPSGDGSVPRMPGQAADQHERRRGGAGGVFLAVSSLPYGARWDRAR